MRVYRGEYNTCYRELSSPKRMEVLYFSNGKLQSAQVHCRFYIKTSVNRNKVSAISDL